MASAQLAQRTQLSLLTIPVELTLHIVEQVAINDRGRSRDGLRAVAQLSLTCKYLEKICSRTLYRSVSLRSQFAMLSFLLTLERKVEVANQVRVLYFESGCSQSRPHDAAAAEDIVRNDMVAEGLLQAGSVCLSALVAMKVLQLLPSLITLSVPVEILEGLQYWPEEQRLQGQGISALQVTGVEYTDCTRPDCCKEWLRSFKPGQLPRSLNSLEFLHSCYEYFPRLCNIEEPSDWAAVAASIKSVSFSTNRNFSAQTLTRFLSPCLQCTDLDIMESLDKDSVMPAFESVADSLTACHGLKSTLSTLRIRCVVISDWAPPRIDGNAYLRLFPQFEALKRLSLPMPPEITETAPSSLAWPPNLDGLELEWVLEGDRSFRTQPFPSFLINVVKAGLVPKSLRTIALNWDIDLDAGFEMEEDMIHLEDVLPVLEATCKSKAIVVRHTKGIHSKAVPLPKLLRNLRKAMEEVFESK